MNQNYVTGKKKFILFVLSFYWKFLFPNWDYFLFKGSCISLSALQSSEIHDNIQAEMAKYRCPKELSLSEGGGRQTFQEVRDLSAKS